MSEEESKKLFRKIKYDEIENDEIINYSKNSQESELQKDSNIHKFEMRKRMLKSRSDDADILIKTKQKINPYWFTNRKMMWEWYFYR